MSKKSAKPGQRPGEIIVRAATVLDATPLYRIINRYLEENPMGYPPPVPNSAMAWGLALVMKGGVVVAEQDRRLIASVAVEVGNFAWNPGAKYLNGVWIYVAPEHRSGGVGNRLIKAAKDIAKSNNLPLRLDNIFGIEPEVQDRWREMHGFRYLGGNHGWWPPKEMSDGR